MVLFLAAAVCLVPFQKIYDDGFSLLSVSVGSTSATPIASASCEAFSSEKGARYTLEHLAPPEIMLYSSVANPFHGEVLEVPIPTSQTTLAALVWSRTGYYQMQFLVIIVHYADGRSEGRLVDIPDLRHLRSLSVEFP